MHNPEEEHRRVWFYLCIQEEPFENNSSQNTVGEKIFPVPWCMSHFVSLGNIACGLRIFTAHRIVCRCTLIAVDSSNWKIQDNFTINMCWRKENKLFLESSYESLQTICIQRGTGTEWWPLYTLKCWGNGWRYHINQTRTKPWDGLWLVICMLVLLEGARWLSG